ncbi:MAG: protein kinase [Clostridia bacterium]|nr:protein kinase [Clostridia bacterium]
MTVKEIYERLLRAKRPVDFFGEATTEEELKRFYKDFAKKVHPDLVPDCDRYLAGEAFSVLNRLYHLGLAEFQQGIYGVIDQVQLYSHQSPLFEITAGGKRYQFFENVFEGEVAYLFKGKSADDDIVYLKVAIDPADNELIDTEYDVLSTLRHQSFPYVEQKIQVNDTRAILMREVKGITMLELLEQYPHGVPAEHVMWMLERLLSAVGYLHANFVVHGNIKPENIIINKENHNVSLVGFSFCIPKANTPEAKYKIQNDNYSAPEVSADATVYPASDVYSVGKIAIALLGGAVSSSGMPISVNAKVRAFIRKMVNPSMMDRPDDAWKLWTELIELRTEVFGTQRFQKLD